MDCQTRMEYENLLIREQTEGPVRWCSQCERDAEDCVCEELSDHFREVCSVGDSGEDVCVPASPEPRSFSDWLQQHGDALPLPTSFSQWMDQQGDRV